MASPTAQAWLNVSVPDFEKELDDRIAAGDPIVEGFRNCDDPEAFEQVRSAYRAWNEHNLELLERRFTTNEIAQKYKAVHPATTFSTLASAFGENARQWLLLSVAGSLL